MLWISLIAEYDLIQQANHERLILYGVGIRAGVYCSKAVYLSELRGSTLASIVLTIRGVRIEVHK
jgi:hypothetical protein